MRVQYRLHIINSNTWRRARSVEHALELVEELVRQGETWHITRRVGSGDDHVIRRGVGRGGLVDEAAG